MSIKEIVEKVEDDMFLKENVIGIGEGLKMKRGELTEEKSIVFIVSKKEDNPSPSEIIPKEIDGIKTDVIEERLEPHAMAKLRKPFMAGDEISSQRGYGTLGMIFRWNGKDYGLTNYHVITYPEQEAVGCRVKHPGGGYYIGKVVRAAHPNDLVADAAIFEMTVDTHDPVSPEMGWNAPGSKWDKNIDSYAKYFPTFGYAANMCGFPHHHQEYDGNIRDYNTGGHLPFANGFGKIDLGEKVWKSGRTSGTTPAIVQMKNASVYIAYSDKPRLMKHQIRMVPEPGNFMPISIPGDSGSCWQDNSNHIVALAFAGGFTETYSSGIATPIQIVFREMFSVEELQGYNLNHEDGWNINPAEYTEDYSSI